MSKILRVLYDFHAEEEGELSVRSGQLVMLKGKYEYTNKLIQKYYLC